MSGAPVYMSLFPAETDESQYTSDLIPASSWILQTSSVSVSDRSILDNSRHKLKEETVSYADSLLPGAELPAHGSGSLIRPCLPSHTDSGVREMASSTVEETGEPASGFPVPSGNSEWTEAGCPELQEQRTGGMETQVFYSTSASKKKKKGLATRCPLLGCSATSKKINYIVQNISH